MSKEPIALFESILSKDPQAYLGETEAVYHVTVSEVREFARQLAADGAPEPVGVVLSEEQMGIGFDRKLGPVLWLDQRRQPGPLYQRPFNTAELLWMIELMAGVCEKAQWLIDSQPVKGAPMSQLAEALEACDEVPPIEDANARDGWLTVFDRIRGILK